MYVCTLQLTIISSIQTGKQARCRLIPESMNSYLTNFFPLHLDLLLTMRRGTYIAAIASGGENPIRKTTLRFDLYCSEVVIFFSLLLMLVHDIIIYG